VDLSALGVDRRRAVWRLTGHGDTRGLMFEQELLRHIAEVLEDLSREQRERHRHLMWMLAVMLGFAWLSW
jgi:hypothetical protein